MKPLTCSNCRFWRRLEGRQGECRRRAPGPLVVSGPEGTTLVPSLAVFWPPMHADEPACGEFGPEPVAQQVVDGRKKAARK